MKVELETQKNLFFFSILKPILKFLHQNAKQGCIFFAVHRTLFSQCIKTHNIICHNLSWHCDMPSPCPDFSSDSINSTLMVVPVCLLMSNGCMPEAEPFSGQSCCYDVAGQGEVAVPAELGCNQCVGCVGHALLFSFPN